MKVKFSFETAREWVMKFRFYTGPKNHKNAESIAERLEHETPEQIIKNSADRELEKMTRNNTPVKVTDRPRFS